MASLRDQLEPFVKYACAQLPNHADSYSNDSITTVNIWWTTLNATAPLEVCLCRSYSTVCIIASSTDYNKYNPPEVTWAKAKPAIRCFKQPLKSQVILKEVPVSQCYRLPVSDLKVTIKIYNMQQFALRSEIVLQTAGSFSQAFTTLYISFTHWQREMPHIIRGASSSTWPIVLGSN